MFTAREILAGVCLLFAFFPIFFFIVPYSLAHLRVFFGVGVGVGVLYKPEMIFAPSQNTITLFFFFLVESWGFFLCNHDHPFFSL
jgi:hypothetical protein